MNKIIISIITLLFLIIPTFGFNLSNETYSEINVLENISQKETEVNPYKNMVIEDLFLNKEKIKFSTNKNKDILTKNIKENHLIIQFNSIPSDNEIKLLKRNGINLIKYLGSNSYYVKITKFLDETLVIQNDSIIINDSELNNKYIIKNIQELNFDNKKSEYVRNLNFLEEKKNYVNLNIKLFENSDKNQVKDKIKNFGISIIGEIKSLNILTIKINKNKIDFLKEIEEIEYLEEELTNFEKESFSSNNNIQVSSLFSTPYNLGGEGVKAFIYEQYLPNNNHSDLGDRISYPYLLSYPYDNHTTHVAGIIIGNGTLNSSNVGVAPKALLFADHFDTYTYNSTSNSIEGDYENAVDDENVQVASNSWGYPIARTVYLGGDINTYCPRYGDYTIVSELFDEIVHGDLTTLFGNPIVPIPVVFSGGNERGYGDVCNNTNSYYPYYTINPPKSAKNIIAVGSINYDNNASSFFSSYGPTDDGRIKPELVAPGAKNSFTGIYSTLQNNNYGNYFDGGPAFGTSMSAPHVSGTIALMLEQWNKSGYQSSIGYSLPSTIKALLLDSTTDLSSSGNGDKVIDGPDYKNGFGLLNATGAVDRIIAGTFKEENISSSNDVDVYSINISSQNELKVTMAWDDPAGSILYNDLDLKLISPSGTTFYPWTLNASSPSDLAKRDKEDHTNNVEQVYINSSEIESGEWLIVVSATSCTTDCPQKYSLVSEEEISTTISSLKTNSNELLAYYKFENNLDDSSTNNNTGTGYGSITYTSGVKGQAIDLDGSNDYVDLGSIYPTITTYSISGWLKDENPDTSYYGVIYKGDISTSNYDWYVGKAWGYMHTRFDGGAQQLYSDSYNDVEENTWHFHTWNIQRNGTVLTIEMYKDGELVKENTFSSSYVNSYNNWYLGLRWYYSGNGYYNGQMDDVTIFNKILEPYEIQQLMVSGLELESVSQNSSNSSSSGLNADSSLLIHYEFENDLTDSSSNSNDATAPNGVTYTSSGYEGSAIDLDGVNDYLSLGSIDDNIETLTISAWMYDENGDTSYYGLLYKGDTSTSNYDWYVGKAWGKMHTRFSGGQTQLYSDNYNDVVESQWAHYVWVLEKDGTNTNVEMYKDGVLIKSGQLGYTIGTTYSNWYLGLRWYYQGNGYYHGRVDDFSVWNRRLSSTEIEVLYEGGIIY